MGYQRLAIVVQEELVNVDMAIERLMIVETWDANVPALYFLIELRNKMKDLLNYYY
jgi:hypothetical protein